VLASLIKPQKRKEPVMTAITADDALTVLVATYRELWADGDGFTAADEALLTVNAVADGNPPFGFYFAYTGEWGSEFGYVIPDGEGGWVIDWPADLNDEPERATVSADGTVTI
jgi:hypothetical protein